MFRLIAILVVQIACIRAIPLLSKGQLPHLDGRVIKGEETTIDRFPYQVGIRFLGGFHCGGSIYKSNVVITSAHCVLNFPPSLMSVIAGSSYRTGGGGVIIDIKEFRVHEQFDLNTHENDIALVILDGHLEFSETIQPIGLASEGEVIPASTRAYITGWGSLQEDGFLSSTLHYGSVSIVNRSECAKAYAGTITLSDSMMCASGEPYGGTDPCIGDYGGPLVSAGKAYGYVTFSDDCSTPGVPRIYSNVAHLRKWINSKI